VFTLDDVARPSGLLPLLASDAGADARRGDSVEQSNNNNASACTAAEAFALLWTALNDVLGSAATSAVLRRSLKHASGELPLLEGLDIRRDGFEYRYSLSSAWAAHDASSLEPLFAQLAPLLVELTGPVIIKRLESTPELEKLCAVMRGES
jgi:hypothetical protein